MLVIQDELDAKQRELDRQKELFDELEQDKVRAVLCLSNYLNDCRLMYVYVCVF